MPFALLFLGMLAFVAAYKDTLGQLAALLKGDLSGPSNFLYWIVALVIVGSLGNFAMFRNSSKMLLLLILVAMAISDKGFFAQFVAALNAPAPATTATTAASDGANAFSSAPASSSTSIVPGVSSSDVTTALTIAGVL